MIKKANQKKKQFFVKYQGSKKEKIFESLFNLSQTYTRIRMPSQV